MAEHKAGAAEHVSGGAAPRASCMSRFRGHCKRFWWLHLIIFIIVVLVIVLPVIYVGYPNIAQDDVNDSTLTITEMEMTNPRPDAVHVRLKQVIGSDSSFHPWLDSFSADLTLSGSTAPFGRLQVPRLQAHDGVEAEIDQELTIFDLEAFTEYAKAIMHNETLMIRVYGETGLKLGGLPKTTVTYDKQVTMKGLNGLKGLNVTEANLLTEPEDDGVNMRGKILIPNPTVLTMAMGNLTLQLGIDDTPIGITNLYDVVVSPGDNIVDMASTVSTSQILRFVGDSYKDGIVPVQITGNSSVYNGERIPYMSDALASNELSIEMNLLDAL